MAAVMNTAVRYLISSSGFFAAALLLSGLTFVAFAVPLIFLPETLQQRRSVKGVSPLTHLRKICGFYFIDGSVRRRATFCVCLLLFIIGTANEINIGSLDALYQMHDPFCWNSVQIGDYSDIRNAGGHLFALILYKLLHKCLAIEYIGMLAVVFQAGGFLMEAFTQVSLMFYLGQLIYY